MHSPSSRLCISVSVVLGLSVVIDASSARADPVFQAIDRGVEFLMKEVQNKQLPEGGNKGVGQVALETYALVVAGVSVDHPVVRGNFEMLHRQCKGSNYTYGLACYIFALDAAISQIENDLLILAPRGLKEKFRDNPRIGAQFRPHLTAAVQQLARLQTAGGGWDYGPPKARFDNSNTQFAVLGLGVGAKRRVPIEHQVWLKIMDHFVKGQQQKGGEIKDRITLMTSKEQKEREEGVKVIPEKSKRKSTSGDKEKKKGQGRTVVIEPAEPEVGTEDIQVFQRGWDYSNKGGAAWNMTCAGLSSLLLAHQNLTGRLAPAQQAALNKAIRDGFGWVMGNWAPNKSYYGIYSVEKVGDIGEVRLFGKHDWFEELSSHLVSAQSPDGSWPGGGSHGENVRVATSFALLVLNRASSLLTRNPASRIMISGRGGAQDPNDRSWVYVPSLDTTVHYPTLLRQIRMRPRVKLVQFLQNIVDNYKDFWKGELIPEMARVRDAIPTKSAKKVVDGYLSDITGYKYSDWEDYLKWHRRWDRIIQIGTQRRKDRVPDLLKYYKSTNKSLTLKRAVVWAIQQCRAKDAVPLFLEDLDHSNSSVREIAYNALKSFFVEFPPPFSPKAPASLRQQQVTKIRLWYQEQLKKRT